MQGFKDSAIGCAVPAPLVRHFLDDVADGRLDGIPELGLRWQGLESATLKASLQVPPGGTGVLLTRVGAAPAGDVLREGDVLLSIGGKDVADDGTVVLREGERTDLSHAADLLPLGASVPVRYLRDGAVRTAEVRLLRARGEGDLVPRLFDRNADWFIFGGLGFITLTRNFLETAKEWAPPRLAALAEREPRWPGEEVILLADLLVSEVNTGYQDRRFKVVRAVDGREVRDIAGLARLVERPDGGPLVVFSLEDGSRVTVDRAQAVATAAEVLARYEVATDRSARLAALAGTKQAAAAPGAGAQ
jgi:hypothetical protein